MQPSIFPRHDFARLEFRRRGIRPYARILKAHSHSMSGSSIWASLVCHCYFWIAGGRLPYLTRWLLTLQLFRNSINTQEKLRLNLHSLSVCVCEWAFRIRAVLFEFLLQDPDTSQFFSVPFLQLFYTSDFIHYYNIWFSNLNNIICLNCKIFEILLICIFYIIFSGLCPYHLVVHSKIHIFCTNSNALP